MSDIVDDLDALRFWADVMTARRGHATMDAKPNHDSDGMQIVERAVAREFCDAMERTHGILISRVTSNPDPNEPPDCLASMGGKPFSIELGELVDGELIGDLRRAHEAGAVMSGREKFDRSQWTPERFAAGLEAVLAKKDAKYTRRGLVFDALVIHSEENWLLPAYVDAWLPAITITPRAAFRNAYFLGQYDPDPEGEGDGGRGLYRLYGSVWS
jgi:hypothetical protein